MRETSTSRDAVVSNQQHSDLEFRRLLEKLPAAAYTCDAEGLITYFNPRAAQLWGREPKLNDPIDCFCGSFKLFSIDGSPIAHSECWMALALRDQKEYNGHEIVIERPDGSRWIALAHANPFRDERGLVRGAVNVLVDITGRKQSEERLREADRRKTVFLAMLAHELRNPLAPLRNGLHILRKSGNNGAVLEEARAMMERQLGHMVRLIDDLLDVSRISNGKIALQFDRLDLAVPVQDAVETSRPLIDERHHEFVFKRPAGPVFVMGDRTRLAQVFNNLLNNSAKYTQRGGHLSLTIDRHGSDVIVRVKDNGVGIPADMLPTVFDMFSQAERSSERSQGGLGIGLSLVRGLVELHGGSVEVHSEGEGKGSEFIVRLPVMVATDEGMLNNGTKHSRAPSSLLRILVVDDNRDAAVSLALLLKTAGHQVRTAYDGVAAVEAAEEFLPDVALLDIGLPRLSGYEVARQIRQQPWGAEMALIALTGWGQEEDKCRSKAAGFNFHLVKPVDHEALQQLLDGILIPPVAR